MNTSVTDFPRRSPANTPSHFDASSTLIRMRELEGIVGMKRSTIYKLMQRPDIGFPLPVKLSNSNARGAPWPGFFRKCMHGLAAASRRVIRWPHEAQLLPFQRAVSRLLQHWIPPLSSRGNQLATPHHRGCELERRRARSVLLALTASFSRSKPILGNCPN